VDIALLEKQTLSRRIVINGEYRTRRNNAGFILRHGDNSFVEELQITGAADAVLGEFILRIDGDCESDFDSQRVKAGFTAFKTSAGHNQSQFSLWKVCSSQRVLLIAS